MRPWISAFNRGTERVARSKSSVRWLREHFDDAWVKKAQAEGARSRATFKLEELIDRDRLLAPGMLVVDLGAAPGGWSKLVRERLGDTGRVVALDVLPMIGLPGVEVLTGDFRDAEVLAALEQRLGGERVDLVLSDMAPNMSGIAMADQARAMELAELAADFSRDWLKPGGTLVSKLFQGAGFDDHVRSLRRDYERVAVRKPNASRSRSREVYALARGKRADGAGIESRK